jgi:uncharacterized protein (DUF1810 family)
MSNTSETSYRFNLQRFSDAQHSLYPTVLAELKSGRKQTHWIWFIFPQVEGLGHSSTARHYAIRSREEAIAYLATPVLSARLIECTGLMMGVPEKSARDILGSPDDMKFRSSMTLFGAVDGGSLYRAALDRFFGGKPDQATLDIVEQWKREAQK